jgi:hypothetical protein
MDEFDYDEDADFPVDLQEPVRGAGPVGLWEPDAEAMGDARHVGIESYEAGPRLDPSRKRIVRPNPQVND